MDVYVLDSNFDRIALIDNHESAIWNIKYFDVSDFELYIAASIDNAQLLRTGNYLVRDKDIINDYMYNVMIIETIEIQTDDENGDYLIVKGHDLRNITARRIIWEQTIFSNVTVESAFRRLLSENVITPNLIARRIDNVWLGELNNYTEKLTQQVTGDNLRDYIVGLFTTYNMGWSACIAPDKKIIFDSYKGVDRSINQSVYPRIVFSDDNENIVNSDYVGDYTGYKNVALVAGEGEGTARKTTSVGNYTGFNRYEVYIDANSVSSNNGEVSPSTYINMLAVNGIEELKRCKRVESFDGEIEPYSNYIYGKDFNIGDIVTVKNMYGVTANPRIIGVIESNSSDGETVIPTFSTWIEEEA